MHEIYFILQINTIYAFSVIESNKKQFLNVHVHFIIFWFQINIYLIPINIYVKAVDFINFTLVYKHIPVQIFLNANDLSEMTFK